MARATPLMVGAIIASMAASSRQVRWAHFFLLPCTPSVLPSITPLSCLKAGGVGRTSLPRNAPGSRAPHVPYGSTARFGIQGRAPLLLRRRAPHWGASGERLRPTGARFCRLPRVNGGLPNWGAFRPYVRKPLRGKASWRSSAKPHAPQFVQPPLPRVPRPLFFCLRFQAQGAARYCRLGSRVWKRAPRALGPSKRQKNKGRGSRGASSPPFGRRRSRLSATRI